MSVDPGRLERARPRQHVDGNQKRPLFLLLEVPTELASLSGALVLAGSMMGRNGDGAPFLIASIPGHGQDRRQHEGGIPLAAGHNCGRNTHMAAGSAAVARTPR